MGNKGNLAARSLLIASGSMLLVLTIIVMGLVLYVHYR
jgi:hypothetical protein